MATPSKPDGTDKVNDAVRLVRDAEARHRKKFGPWRDDPWPRAERVALFLDFENLALGATTSLPDHTEPIPDRAVTWLCRAYGADIRMAVDAMETLITHPAVEAFILVTGDSDFSPLVTKLREFAGRQGVGAEESRLDFFSRA
ncbi:NYN domain-containing protein [Kibdelosporangium philippinense]|uniref:NYN domain-containing protein n=1 Tax=Kibdelosporangium philippinense TaxID=211113 RepID=A0ABS8ZZH6_9PSEU|nr:NYN domain-containing protein [Kibdelosporangium philippinense]MCE7011742.1 NYN domain-containing protein [Kibdelosporangium philippinense]